jgi:hypothetical protein
MPDKVPTLEYSKPQTSPVRRPDVIDITIITVSALIWLALVAGLIAAICLHFR